MFRRVLVANRGEIAARIIRACRTVGARSVAVYSEADADSPHLADADETVCIGPGPAARSYLDADAILQAAVNTECQAVHPGFGFLSENARFVARCRQLGLAFVGPTSASIRRMGDKATARETMKAAGLPVLPGSEGLLDDVATAKRLAADIGYPVLLKATAGGGGKGMRIAHDEGQLEAAWRDATREAEKAFGDGGLYLEKYVVGGRHIEFQVLADHYGHVIHLGERECSIQRNHQKLLEEAPSTGMSAEARAEMGARVCAAAKALGYRNAGTVEFLMDADGSLYFMEMNTRIQVEHPVTELVTGIDLVAWQLRIAAGERLSVVQDEVELRGHAIEVRINAEDPSAGFRPAPGTIERFEPPAHDVAGPVRLDSHVRPGYRIPPYYDSMIGKLIVHGTDRADAIARLSEALDGFTIEGVPTTLPLHRAIAAEPSFRAGGYTCQYLPEHPDLLAQPAPDDRSPT